MTYSTYVVFAMQAPRVVDQAVSDRTLIRRTLRPIVAQYAVRPVQHHGLDRFGVGLLLRRHQHLFGLPTAGRGHVLHGVTLAFGGPFAADRVPHPATLRDDLRQLVRPP